MRRLGHVVILRPALRAEGPALSEVEGTCELASRTDPRTECMDPSLCSG
jgi:hypothetical protein